jgi:hypothetical protein
MKNEDDLKALYEDANRLEAEQPGAQVRAAALAQAKAVLASAPRTAPSDVPHAGKVRGTDTVASNSGNWKMAIAASVVMVPLLGILVSHLYNPQASDAPIQVASNTSPRESGATQQAEVRSPAPMAAPPEAVPSKSTMTAQSTAPTVKRADASPRAAQESLTSPAAPAVLSGTSDKSDNTITSARSEALVVAKQDISDAKVTDSPTRAQSMGMAGSQSTVVAQAAAPASPAMMSAPVMNAARARMKNSLAATANDHGVTFSDQLAQAAREGDVNEIDALVKRGVPVNGLDSMGKTALLHAVQARQPKSIEVLVRLGADPLVKGKDGVSALEGARRIGDAQILILLGH